MISLRIYRPFPVETLLEYLADVPVVGVLDKAVSFGAPGGPLYEDVKTTFYDQEKKPLIANYVHGLGGRDASPKLLKGIYEDLLKIRKKGEVTTMVNYTGVRE